MVEIFENQEHMISYYRNKAKVVFDRVDKNGTHIFHDLACRRCGGTGVIPHFGHVDHGTCFACRGTGKDWSSEEIKIYTDEYGAKLLEKRKARGEKKRQEMLARSEGINKKWLEDQGFNANGITFIVLGNTYEMKEQLKANGAKYNELLGWHMPDPKNFDTVEVEFKLVTHRQYNGLLSYDSPADVFEVVSIAKEIGERRIKESRHEHISEYIGQIGERRDFVCKLIGTFTYNSNYGFFSDANYIYKFKDDNGDIIVWYTTSIIDTDNEEYRFKATIKEHSEYRGEKQTVVNRPKFY